MWWFKRKVTYKQWKEYKQQIERKEDLLFMHTVAKQSLQNSGGESCGNMTAGSLQLIKGMEVLENGERGIY